MSDVTVAPAGSAPAAAPNSSPPTSPANEVQINPSPVHSPTPLGPQTPDAPVSEHRPRSPREAIQAAFDRASNPTRSAPKADAKPAPKAAEAKPGHNQPPEEMEKLDLKRRPTDSKTNAQSNSAQSNQAPQSNAQSNEQPRDRGRFAPREQAEGAEQAQSGAAQTPAKQLPPDAPFREPPTRMSEQARADWGNTPETVRGEVHRQQTEFAKAYKVYKGSFESMKTLWPYVKMAKDHGTTLEQALGNYTGMEAKLRSDPIAGLDLIVHNLGLKGQDGQPITLRDISYHVLSQTPDQLRSTQTTNNVQAAAHQIGALHQEVEGLKNALHQMHTQQRFTYTRSTVDQFAEQHPRFDELGDLIEAELKLGFDLDTAYRRAELLRPSTHAAQTRTTSAQTRTADRSIHGSPDSPSNGVRQKPKDTSRSPREAIAKAMGRVSGLNS
jgi:hypothetical protein